MGGFLARIEVQGIRNLGKVSVEPSRHINLLYGANGSGKSSFLEAIYLLGLGRSFRTSQFRQVIREGESSATVFGEYLSRQGITTILGVEKKRDGSTTIRVNGQPVRTSSELARRLPLQLLDSRSSWLIEGGPRYRRHYLNWGMFHVEQEFFPVWRKFLQALHQRNNALRRRLSDSQISAWDRELVRHAHRITDSRKRYLSRLSPLLKNAVGSLLNPEKDRTIELRFFPGWNEEKEGSLENALIASLDRDREKGYTQLGPHRADLHIFVDGYPAREHVSRGEQKLLAVALQMCQVELMTREIGLNCVLLMDDLPAELDAGHRAALIEYVRRVECQAFVTATEKGLLEDHLCRKKDAMFHVEHGSIKKMV